MWLELDDESGNSPRLRVMSVREEKEIALDPVALSLLCELDRNVLGLLADIARDPAARQQFADWFATRHDPLVVPEGLTGPGAQPPARYGEKSGGRFSLKAAMPSRASSVSREQRQAGERELAHARELLGVDVHRLLEHLQRGGGQAQDLVGPGAHLVAQLGGRARPC